MIGGRLLPFHQEKRRYNLKESLNGKGLPEAHCKTRQRAGVRGEIGVHEKNLVYRWVFLQIGWVHLGVWTPLGRPSRQLQSSQNLNHTRWTADFNTQLKILFSLHIFSLLVSLNSTGKCKREGLLLFWWETFYWSFQMTGSQLGCLPSHLLHLPHQRREATRCSPMIALDSGDHYIYPVGMFTLLKNHIFYWPLHTLELHFKNVKCRHGFPEPNLRSSIPVTMRPVPSARDTHRAGKCRAYCVATFLTWTCFPGQQEDNARHVKTPSLCMSASLSTGTEEGNWMNSSRRALEHY